GKRRQEIAMIEASLASARAQAVQAVRVKQRQATLLGQKIVSQANYDTAATNAELAGARVAELEATLAAARLPARPDEIKAGEAAVAQAMATVDNARWRLSKRTLVSQKPATVFDIIRRPGEVAGPQAPVLSVLPDGAVKLRFYLPEAQLSRIALGTVLNVSCRGCDPGKKATVSYIANEPEFTPPVIYSIDNRQKLVYLIEARPQAGGPPLKPGQIVDVGFAGAAP
ncbi:MAG: HlyD family secretion protein, partial [Hyphomicrobiales bacterium]